MGVKKSTIAQNKLKKRIKKLELENLRLKKQLNKFTEIKNTVRTPEVLSPFFSKAEKTVNQYFKNIDFSPSQGTITINDDRYVLIRASSLSYGFFKEIKKLYRDAGENEAFDIGQNFLFDIGHVIGLEDAKQFHNKMGLKDPIDKLSAGPIHFAYSGWAFVEILHESNPASDENFFLKYHHPYSFEADSWIKKGQKSDKPVCIMNAAYSSGWCEQSFGMELTAVEVACKAKGDEQCTFIMAPPHKIQEYLPTDGQQKPKQHKVPVFFERKHIEGAIKQSLSEKETLLKEIHHRVKNNLQIISSLLNLQFINVNNNDVIEAISKSKDRINTMALIHTKLYMSNNLASIDFGEYINELTTSIASSYALNDNIKCVVKYTDAHFDLDLSINLGLIINELLTNSYKHAFQNKKSGLIKIELTRQPNNKYQLIIEDNGIGIPSYINIDNPQTLGLEIVVALTDQIGGTIERNLDQKSKYTITFEGR